MTNEEAIGVDMKVRLSTLWIFAILNYLYCDVVSLFDPSNLKNLMAGYAGPMSITPGFLLGTAIMMEIPIAMVLLSRVLNHPVNRWANIIAGTIMTVIQFSSLFIGKMPMPFYLFFSVMEIPCTVSFVWSAVRWHAQSSIRISEQRP